MDREESEKNLAVEEEAKVIKSSGTSSFKAVNREKVNVSDDDWQRIENRAPPPDYY